MQRNSKAGAQRAIVAGLATMLCCSALGFATPAAAVTTDELQAKVDAAAQNYDEATARVSELEAQASESQAKIDEVEAQLPEQQQKASVAIRTMYKMQQDSPGLVGLLLSSENFADFLSTYQYISSVQRANAADAQALADMQSALLAAQQTLEASQEEASSQQQAAESALAEAQSALDELNAQLAAEAAAKAAAEAAAAAQAEAEAAAAAQAESEAAAQEDASASPSDSGSTSSASSSDSASSSSSGGSSSSSSGSSNSSSNASATDGSEVDTEGSWMIGSASAYSMADNTGWDATASGEKLTDDSVTVAVPMDQRYLLGRSVQIRWNGITITARVNDVGGFAAYGRVLDLAGGCWKAFGFSSPEGWGVRTVQYRFL